MNQTATSSSHFNLSALYAYPNVLPFPAPVARDIGLTVYIAEPKSYNSFLQLLFHKLRPTEENPSPIFTMSAAQLCDMLAIMFPDKKTNIPVLLGVCHSICDLYSVEMKKPTLLSDPWTFSIVPPKQ